MDAFLKRVARPQEQPQAGPSEGVPEGDTVITGDDSFTGVTDPEDLPVGERGGGDSDIDVPNSVKA